MEYQSEKKAKDFLEKQGFQILKSFYLKKAKEISRIKNIKFPIVVKVAGKKIIHKKKIGGVKLNVKNYSEYKKAFREMSIIKNFEGVVIQPQVKGKEIFLGIKKTPEFGQVIIFGKGGTNVEEKKDLSFRVSPIEKPDAVEMLKETKISSELNKQEKDSVVKNILKLNQLAKKYSDISELDINPLIVKNNFAKIIDARILWK